MRRHVPNSLPSGASRPEPRSGYRFRTATLHGPWRATPEEAARDAIRAGQAFAEAGAPFGIHWRVPGEIEQAGFVGPA